MNTSTSNKEPQTIRQKLESVVSGIPRPAVSGGAGVSAYVGARPNPIARDTMAGTAYGQLAYALKDVNKELGEAYGYMMQERNTKAQADAANFNAENPDLTKDMETWKKAAEKDPRLLNISPHVKRKIEEEVLQNEGISFYSQVMDAYATSGIKNERDPEKVRTWIGEQRANYMKEKGLDTYEGDAVFLARSFTKPTDNLTETILRRHTQDIESQNAGLLEQKMFADVDGVLTARQNISIGGTDLKIPAERRAYIAQTAAPLIMAKAEELKSLGYSQDRIAPLLSRMVLSAGSHSPQTARQLAEAVTIPVRGKDGQESRVPLITQEGVRLSIEKLEEQAEDKAWKHTARAHQQAAWGREEASRNALNNAIAYGADPNNTDFSKAKIVDELKLCSAGDYLAFKQASTASAQGNFRSLYTTPTAATQALIFESDLKRGLKGRADVLELAQSGYNPAEVQRLLSIADKNNTAEGQGLLLAQKEIAKTYLSTVGQMSMQEASDLYEDYADNGTGSGGKSKAPQALFIDLLQRLPDVEAGFSAFIDQKRQERNVPEQGNDSTTTAPSPDASFSQMEIQSLKQQYIAEKLNNEMHRMKEQTTQRLGIKSENMGMTSYLKSATQEVAPAMQDMGGGFSSGIDQNSAGAKAMQASLTAVNTLLTGAEGNPAFTNARTLADILTTANSMTEGGLSWRESFFIATGGLSPEKAGVSTVEEAKAFLPAYFAEKGFTLPQAPAPEKLNRRNGGL